MSAGLRAPGSGRVAQQIPVQMPDRVGMQGCQGALEREVLVSIGGMAGWTGRRDEDRMGGGGAPWLEPGAACYPRGVLGLSCEPQR